MEFRTPSFFYVSLQPASEADAYSHGHSHSRSVALDLKLEGAGDMVKRNHPPKLVASIYADAPIEAALRDAVKRERELHELFSGTLKRKRLGPGGGKTQIRFGPQGQPERGAEVPARVISSVEEQTQILSGS